MMRPFRSTNRDHRRFAAALALALAAGSSAPGFAATACKTASCGACSGNPPPSHISTLIASNDYIYVH